jgi:poly-beta-1,6-N-acetyl-D-glucosamine synthase
MQFGIILMYLVIFFGLYTSIFLLITLFENLENIKRKASKKLHKVSVIVPAFNEEKTIAKTIESLLALDYPKDKIEIIVIDDGSTDETYKIAKQYKKEGVRVYKKKNEGKGKTLNFGLTKATGSFISCLDADSFVAPDSLKRLMSYFYDSKIMAVTPSLKIYKPKNFLQKVQMMEFYLGIYLRKMFSFLGSIHVTPGPFSVYRKEFFDKYGGYDEDNLTEDIEVALRIQSKGYYIENSVDANVYTMGPATFKELFRQRLRWYMGFIENVLNYKHLFSKKHGNLGLYILPSSFITVFLAITVLFYTIVRLTSTTIQNYINLKSINFDIFSLINFDISLFYININPLLILSVISIITGISVILIAKHWSKGEDRIITAYIPFMIGYAVLFAFWWFMALTYKFIRRKVSW